MITVPLRETYSGDFFVNTGVSWTKDKYFAELNDINYPEKRVSPIVYQRIWETEKKMSGKFWRMAANKKWQYMNLVVGQKILII